MMKFPDFVVYHELVQTTKEYIRNVCVVEAKWLPEVAPNLFQENRSSQISNRKQIEKIQPLRNKFQEPDAWRLKHRVGFK